MYRPVEDCYQNGAEEVTPPDAPEGEIPPAQPQPHFETSPDTPPTDPENPDGPVSLVTPPTPPPTGEEEQSGDE